MSMGFVYYTGHLAIDRLQDAALDEMATKKMLLAETGKVRLYQRRCLHGFEYICVPVKGA